MKKSIVLLITLFFITSISILILKNIDNTSEYINKQEHKFQRQQVFVLLSNIKNEAKKIILNYPNDIDNKDIVLKVEDYVISLKLNIYDNNYNVNRLLHSNTIYYKEIEEFFFQNNIQDFDMFKTMVNEKKKVTSSKQLDDIVSDFLTKTYQNDIIKLKEKLSFLPTGEELLNSLFYEIRVQFSGISSSSAYFIFDKEGEVIYFEFSF